MFTWVKKEQNAVKLQVIFFFFFFLHRRNCLPLGMNFGTEKKPMQRVLTIVLSE